MQNILSAVTTYERVRRAEEIKRGIEWRKRGDAR